MLEGATCLAFDIMFIYFRLHEEQTDFSVVKLSVGCWWITVYCSTEGCWSLMTQDS